MEEKSPRNCTTQIARKVGKNERFQPRGNMHPRATEVGYDRYLGRTHRVKQLWIMESESPNYLKITEADENWHSACSRGEIHLYGRARWRQIAQDLVIPYEEVAYYLRR